jgi:hypothetical protein
MHDKIILDRPASQVWNFPCEDGFTTEFPPGRPALTGRPFTLPSTPMVFLHFDSDNVLDCFDNPNCFFNEEGIGCRRELGDPGYVLWFPPGYVPPKPPPKPKPARRRHLSNPQDSNSNPNAPHTMSIPYYIRPTTDGSKVTTTIAYRGTKTKAEMIAGIQARLTAAGVTVTDDIIGKVLQHHDEAVIDFGMDAWKMEPVGHIGHFFSGGGSSSDLQGPCTYASMNLGLSCNLDDDGEARAEAAFAGENLGHKGRVMPIFAKVSDLFTKLPNHYTAGKSVLIELGNRSIVFDPQRGHKVQWRLADNTLVDADDYGFIEGTRISAHIPATGVTGPIHLVLTLEINGRLVTDTYDHTLDT